MTTISLVATDQFLSVAIRPKVASGDQNSVKLHVDFDSKWDSYGKSAVFYTEDNGTIYEMVLTDGNCVIPHEVLAKPGILYIGIRGVNADNNAIKTSSLVKYKIAEGAPVGDGTTVEPTPDVYQQILTAYEAERARVNNHKEDTNNPHGVTAAQACAAPAGYGLGEQSATAQNWNTQGRNGFYREKTNGPDGTNMWYGITCSSFNGEATNIAFNPSDTGSTMALRHNQRNKTPEWEYVNPPMIEEEEYRTTERYLGKPVYAKIVNFGNLSNAGFKSVSHGTNISKAIRYEIIAKNSGYMLKGHKDIAYVAIERDNIALSTTNNMSGYDVYFAIWYTKD